MSEKVLNENAVAAPFATQDKQEALVVRREELLDLIEQFDGDRDWMHNPNNELRRMLRTVTSEERKVNSTLKAASAAMRRDFDLSHD